MKVKLFFFFIPVLLLLGCKTNKTLKVNSWLHKKDFTGGYLVAAVSFVVNDTLYAGTGIHDTYTNHFYRYDYQHDSWKTLPDIPFQARSNAISFSINNYGYIGLGEGHSGSDPYSTDYFNDLWRYNPRNGQWKKMSDFPGSARSFSTSFVIGNKAYVTGGNSAGDNDLWEYDADSNTWTKKADYPGGCSARQVSFSINDKGYAGLGWNGGNTCDDLWEYDPNKNLWTQKAKLPGKARYDAVTFTINGKGYVVCGINQVGFNQVYLNNMWSYNPEHNSWTQISNNYHGNGRAEMIAEMLNKRIIIGLGTSNEEGGPYDGARDADIWEYIPDLSK